MFRLYSELAALRRGDAVLQRQDREAMEVIAASDALLLVRLWHGREQRLIVVNSGVGIDEPPGAAGVPEHIAAMPWRVLFSTEERRFGGSDDQARFDADLVALPPYSAVLLAATRPSPPERAAAAVRSALERVRRSG